MLISLVVILRPTSSGSLPPMHGAALHAAFFDWLRALDPAYATRLHDESGSKPFTLSLIRPTDMHPSAPVSHETLYLTPDAAYGFRITALEPGIGAMLHRLSVMPPTHIKVLGQRLTVQRLTVNPAEHQWAAVSSYADIAHPPSRSPKVQLQFVAPTTFRSNGRLQPVPLPELVWGSLAVRWNTFQPVPLPPDFAAQVHESVAISAYDIRTALVGMEGTRRESRWVCFSGWCEYTIYSDDTAFIGWVQTLARYAFFAGVGYKTTMGFGQVVALA